jgi:RNA polymerase sigma factor (sigma-70 family)
VTLADRLRRRPAGLLARSRHSSTAFADFYAEMSPRVLRYFARATGEPHRAFDLMAETFAKAYEKRRDFRGEDDSQAASWLWAIARSELAQFRRSRSVEFAALTRLQLERPMPSDAELRRVEELSAAGEAQAHLAGALELLPADQREVIRMHFIDHLGYDEIARRLGVSNDVVRARCSRGLKTLRANDQVHEAVHALEA